MILLRRKLPQVACDCNPCTDIPQQHRAKQERQTVGNWHSSQRKITAVQTGQPYHRVVQPIKAERQYPPGQNPRTEAIQRAHIQKGPAHIAVSAADQFNHFYLGAAVFNMKTNGIAYHQK
ncbi:hypothetical protein D3C78_1294420 [compost metagenome]